MNVIAATDLWFPRYQPTIGWPPSLTRDGITRYDADPLRYVVWVDPLRDTDELAPRQALHLIDCRNGAGTNHRPTPSTT